jgi:hypothetical protein
VLGLRDWMKAGKKSSFSQMESWIVEFPMVNVGPYIIIISQMWNNE